jgi:hypothetical protein
MAALRVYNVLKVIYYPANKKTMPLTWQNCLHEKISPAAIFLHFDLFSLPEKK